MHSSFMDLFAGIILGAAVTWWVITTFYDVLPVGKSWAGARVSIARTEKEQVSLVLKNSDGRTNLELVMEPEEALKFGMNIARKAREIEFSD